MLNQYSNLTIYPVLALLVYPTLSYFVPDGATAGTWQSAQTQCATAGSTLATDPGVVYHHAALDVCHCYCEEKLISNADCRCWIGLKANVANQPFTYDDNTMIDTTFSYGFTDGNRPTTTNSEPWAVNKPSE
eukprot:768062_1